MASFYICKKVDSWPLDHNINLKSDYINNQEFMAEKFLSLRIRNLPAR